MKNLPNFREPSQRKSLEGSAMGSRSLAIGLPRRPEDMLVDFVSQKAKTELLTPLPVR